MKKYLNAGMIGCGDYLRWEIDKINNSRHLLVRKTFDIDPKKNEQIARKISATPAATAKEVLEDPGIDIVLLFTPPWIREEYFTEVVKHGKHIITTKPLASGYSMAGKLHDIVNGKVSCSVFYGRAGDAATETLKRIFDSGEIGSLAIYKEDWLHHYPHWNDWATDPDKNGGPFMDAMVHNLNRSRYLIGSEPVSIEYSSKNHVQELRCNDTESMLVTFKNGAGSYLFITWAADLEIFDPEGNDREHLGIIHLITSEGWYVEVIERDGNQVVTARREGETKEWPVEDLHYTPYDEVALGILESGKVPYDISDAMKDMEIMDRAISKHM